MLPEVAAASVAACLCLCLHRCADKMLAFGVLLHFLCFVLILIGKIHGLYEDQAGLFDW